MLDKVAVPPTAVLGASVGGVAVFRRHLADYRPLVAATCLGAAAAAVDDWVERVLAAPNAGSGLPDPVVERLGDLRGRVLLALGGLFTGAAGPGAVDGSWSKMVKAQAVNTAIEVVRAVVHADGDRARRGAGRRARRGTPDPGRTDRVRGGGRRAGAAAALGRRAVRAVFGGDPGRDLGADLDDAAAPSARLIRFGPDAR